MKGKFITIYGINNIGKTTQSKLLVEKLKKAGYKAKYLKYPIYKIRPSGYAINKILRSRTGQKISEEELQLWFVINRYQFEPRLKKLLNAGYIVVAEDYIGTGIAWGVAKGLKEEWMEKVNENLLKEDFSILLEGNRNFIAKEVEHLHEQNDILIEKCARVHLHLASKYGWHKIKVRNQIEATSDFLFKTVDDFLRGI